MTTLPDKPSDLIRVAIADLEKCEADPSYSIDMSEWHRPSGEVCRVCLAGAVMAKTQATDPREDVSPGSITDGHDWNALRSLDDFRTGDWGCALEFWGIDQVPAGLVRHKVIRYSNDPALFKADMLKAAEILAEAGL